LKRTTIENSARGRDCPRLQPRWAWRLLSAANAISAAARAVLVSNHTHWCVWSATDTGHRVRPLSLVETRLSGAVQRSCVFIAVQRGRRAQSGMATAHRLMRSHHVLAARGGAISTGSVGAAGIVSKTTASGPSPPGDQGRARGQQVFASPGQSCSPSMSSKGARDPKKLQF
jgi:hypothetical protein